jgi:hypothetical protein
VVMMTSHKRVQKVPRRRRATARVRIRIRTTALLPPSPPPPERQALEGQTDSPAVALFRSGPGPAGNCPFLETCPGPAKNILRGRLQVRGRSSPLPRNSARSVLGHSRSPKNLPAACVKPRVLVHSQQKQDRGETICLPLLKPRYEGDRAGACCMISCWAS